MGYVGVPLVVAACIDIMENLHPRGDPCMGYATLHLLVEGILQHSHICRGLVHGVCRPPIGFSEDVLLLKLPPRIEPM